MVQYDDTASDEPVRVYDRGMDMLPPTPANFGEHQLIYRTGDVIIPRVEPAEPLRLELEDFAVSIRMGSEPRSSLQLGIDVVAAVESIKESMLRSGVPLALGGGTTGSRQVAA
jgi:predicted dehydrogenase